jgi:hypothetical protein
LSVFLGPGHLVPPQDLADYAVQRVS